MNTQVLQQINTQINTVVQELRTEIKEQLQELRDRIDVIDARTSSILPPESPF